MIINMKGFRPEHKAIVVGFLYVSTVLGLLDDIGIDEIRKANEPRNPGRPLDEKDFEATRDLSMTPPGVNTEGLMMTPLEKSLEELELIGEENMMKRRGGQRTVTSNLIYRWPGSVMHYSIDAAFTTNERAVIAAGMEHVSERTCITFEPRTDQDYYVDIIP